MSKRKLHARVLVTNQSYSQLPTLKEIQINTQRMLHVLKRDKVCVSVILMTDHQIKKVNKQYLKHSYATDVLAFSQIVDKKEAPPMIDGYPFLGDIVVSITTARREAHRRKHSLNYELFFYIAHGLLHLFGYDDKTYAERAAMHRKQEEILKKTGVLKNRPRL